MLKLIYYQWRYSWKEWTATVPVFFMASLISGISLSGDFNIIANKDVLLSVQTDPSPVFLMPIFFGGITLFLIISSLIASLLDYFKSDYQLWEILGANRWQLSILVAGQTSLMAFISSIPGALIATPISRYYYYYLQKYFGKGMMPDLNFGSQPLALLATVALISSLAFVSGYFYTSKLLKQKVERKAFKFWIIVKKAVPWAILVVLYASLLFMFYHSEPILGTGSLLYLMLVNVFAIYALSPYLQIGIIKLLSPVLLSHRYAPILAKWQILSQKSYLKAINASVVTGITLVGSFQLLSQNIFSFFQKDGELELLVSFIAFFLAPVLLILANVVSMTLLSVRQEAKEQEQLATLGVSPAQLLNTKLWESLIITGLAFFISLVINLAMIGLMNHSLRLLKMGMTNWTGLFLPAIILSTLLFLLTFITKVSHIKKQTF